MRSDSVEYQSVLTAGAPRRSIDRDEDEDVEDEVEDENEDEDEDEEEGGDADEELDESDEGWVGTGGAGGEEAEEEEWSEVDEDKDEDEEEDDDVGGWRGGDAPPWGEDEEDEDDDEDEDEDEDAPLHLGDIAISRDAVVRQAAAAGHSVAWECAYLFAHGLLHLVGYDDSTDAGYRAMVAHQEAVLAEAHIAR